MKRTLRTSVLVTGAVCALGLAAVNSGGSALGASGHPAAAPQVRSVAADATGTVWTAGVNTDGQLGNGSSANRSTFGVVTTTAGGPALANITEIAGGREHVLALTADGQVWAWGDNAKGQVGSGTSADAHSPVLVKGLPNPAVDPVVQVATDHYGSLALTSTGAIYAWGLNAGGQLGDGTRTLRRSAVLVKNLPAGKTPVEVRGGADFSMARMSDGTVYAWGLGADGELGNGSTAQSSVPVQVLAPAGTSGPLTGVTEIAGGRDHALAIVGGRVYTWGLNAQGQLGNGSKTNSSRPVLVPSLSGAVAVSGGAKFSTAVLGDGTVWTWGQNNLGQLGVGTKALHTTPVKAALPPAGTPTMTGIVAIGTGRDHTLAMDAAGDLAVWGDNVGGQLGDGSTTNRLKPIEVGGLGPVTQAGGGHDYSVVLVPN